MDKRQQEVRQLMMNLPYFNYEVPVVYLQDGTPYIPVIVLCRMLGLHAANHLRRWRRLLLWKCSRKLPMWTANRGTRIVWCLHFGALPLWYTSFNWRHVFPERREQLLKASCELVHVPDQVYHERLTHYRHLRHFLFWFLTTYVDAETFLNEVIRQWHPVFDEESTAWLEELITQGKVIIRETTTLARGILQAQEMIPVVDACEHDHYGNVIGTFSLPLLPIVSAEDEEELVECITMLQEWFHDIMLFLYDR